jgi:predicted deacylase
MKRATLYSFINRNAARLAWGLLGISALIALIMMGILFTSERNLGLSFPASPPPIRTVTLTTTHTRAVTPTIATTRTSTPTSTITVTAIFTPTLTVTPTSSIRETFAIGKSVEERPLEVYRYGDGPIVRMIVAGIHGGYETNTSELIYALMDDLDSGLIVVPEEVTLYLLPVFNIDGFSDYPNLPTGRPNAHGVDLNRNWSVFWQADWDRTGCFSKIPTTAGKFPFSEPETQALRDFLRNKHVDALISYHSAMSAIYAGGRPKPDRASDSLARALAQASPYLYPLVNDPCLYTGQLIDWASKNNIAAVDVELKNHKETDLFINREILQAFLMWKP